MFKKVIILFIFVFFQSSYLYSREFYYEVYGLNINFLNLKLNLGKNKLYSIINSKGLTSYFMNSQSIIQTSYNQRNNSLYYFFNSRKKNKKKTYYFTKINNEINFEKVKFNKGKNFKTITKNDLYNTVDPLTAVRSILFSNTLNSECNKSKKIYDGDDVYKAFLTPIKIKYSLIKYKKKKYKINFSCRLNYKTISGHKFNREKKLNSMYLDVYFSNLSNDIIPVYFETKAKVMPLKMYLSTVLTP